MKKTVKKVVAATAVTASVPVPMQAAPIKPTIAPPPAAITIEAKIDVGFGNRLFLRGQGEGLSWERGTPLECIDSRTWRLIVPSKEKVQFKLLMNDTVWAHGDDVVAIPGKPVELVPKF